MSAKGVCNHYIEDAFASGLKYEDGSLRWPSGKVIKPTQNGKRMYVSLGPSDARRSFLFARLVCWAVNGPPPNPSDEVDHIDRDPSNDAPDNLRWSTTSENQLNISDSERQRRADNMRACAEEPRRGEDSVSAKLTNEDVMEIRRLWCEDYLKQRDIGKRFGIVQSVVQRIITGESWGHLPVRKRIEPPELLKRYRALESALAGIRDSSALVASWRALMEAASRAEQLCDSITAMTPGPFSVEACVETAEKARDVLLEALKQAQELDK